MDEKVAQDKAQYIAGATLALFGCLQMAGKLTFEINDTNKQLRAAKLKAPCPDAALLRNIETVTENLMRRLFGDIKKNMLDLIVHENTQNNSNLFMTLFFAAHRLGGAPREVVEAFMDDLEEITNKYEKLKP